jgi:RNA polymerase sigma factor (sigma-70 family)
MTADPFSKPEELIRRVYAYVAYRIGDGPDAEDVAGDALERAIRYRKSYDPRKGEPLSWLIGIARGRINDLGPRRTFPLGEQSEVVAPPDLADEAAIRLTISAAVADLSERERELIALKYGAGLTAAEIARVLDERTNAVEVALHRARTRLKAIVEGEREPRSEAAAGAR